jgi:NAD(P)-dependent dehydrogenase (short-subunit alcohol dehydrogenase family)
MHWPTEQGATDMKRLNLYRLDGKVAVITGGNSGIGLATAKRFNAEGAYVYITGRRQHELDAAVKAIGNDVTGVLVDVANLSDLDRLYAKVKQQHGHIDILFANAGVAEHAPLGEITEAHFDQTFNVNVKGVLFTVQKALPLISDGGSIILNASIVASSGMSALSVYSATKAAIRSFARTWTMDLKDRHIRVNAISPGPIDTPGMHELEGSEKQIEKNLVSAVPMGRLGSPDEVANAVVFLASNASSFITGAELFVDGGMAQI